MGLGADQLEALAECVDLINTGRRLAGGSSGEAGGSPAEASWPSAGAGQSSSEAGRPSAGAGESSSEAGRPSAGAGESSSEAGRPSAGAGESSSEAGGSSAQARGRHVGADELADIRGVITFARRYRVENRSAVRASDVPRLRDLRARLDAIVVACETGREERAIRDLNALLAETGAVPRIVTHDGRPPHIHVSSATAPLADRIAAHSAMGLAELIVAGESGRVRSCASPQCDLVFVDLSRNQSRRYCDSRTCGNRVHVAAYRSRQSASTDPAALAR